MNKEDREFQYDLTKAQVDFEFLFGVIIALLAILYGLLSLYQNNLGATYLTIILIGVAAVLLFVIAELKERHFKRIRRKYIEAKHDANCFKLRILGIDLVSLETDDSRNP